MELKADELVLEKIKKGEEKEYAKSLVKLLPISQEEKQSSKVLCVTDGKKNMERRIKMIKLSDKFKEYKTLIGVTTLTLTLCIGMLVFTHIEPKKTEILNNVRYFEIPDRIVYKTKNEDKYYVFNKGEECYSELTNMLITCIDGIGEGERLSAEQIKTIEENENYIELDYNTISKNYVIAYEKQNYNVIKRTDDGGVVVKSNIKRKNNLKELIKNKTQNMKYYQMEDNKEYKSEKEIIFTDNNTFFGIKRYEDGIYGIKIQNKENLDKLIETYNIEIDGKIEEETFEKAEVIAMISKYEIENINTRIGGITYKFKEKKKSETYNVNLFVASKAINTNCIYRELPLVPGLNGNNVSSSNISSEELEKLKKELLNQEEFSANIKQIKNNSSKNLITLTCQVTNYYKESDEPTVAFDVDMIVDENTQILSQRENQSEQLEKIRQVGDMIYIKLREEDKQKGNFVIENIEVLGC